MTTSRRRKISNALPACSFRLAAIDGSFTAKDLQKQSPPQIVKQHTWVWPYLKFLAYREGLLQLLNTHKNQSFHLALQVQDHTMTAARNNRRVKHLPASRTENGFWPAQEGEIKTNKKA